MTTALHALARVAAQVRSGELVAAPSPCVSVCRMNPDSGLCDGCFRTIDEIAAWSRLDDPARRAVWALIELRAGLRSMA